ncbi:MAG: SPOR domain-containing protein [Mongoliitalea sp.]
MDLNDKDYGFPFVEPVKLDVKNTSSNRIATAAAQVAEQPKKSENKPVAQVEKNSDYPSENKAKTTSKKSKGITVFLIASLLLILAVMAYFLYYEPQVTGEKTVATTDQIMEEIALEDEELMEEIIEDTIVEEEPVEIEASAPVAVTPAPTAPSSQPAPVATRPTGQRGNLEPVASKGARPTYYIVVGSVPNESLAKEESEKYLANGVDLWMILPNEESRNYRLAAGRYASFTEASNALEQAKAQFSESVWILKY